MAFTTEEKDGRTILKVEGALSIYEASALREALLACLENDAGLELDLGSVTECDTAGLQLLYAARKTAREGEKRFSIADASQTVFETIRSAGLNPNQILDEEISEQRDSQGVE